MEIVGALNDARKEVLRLLENPQRTVDITSEVNELSRILGTVQQMSGDAAEHVRSSVKDILDSLAEPGVSGIISSTRGFFGKAGKLDEVQKKLESLTTQVVVVDCSFQLKKELPRIYNETLELPEVKVGLHRADKALQFLKTSQNLAFRVIGIYGLPGVGKTTLLDVIWNKVSWTAPFAAQAYVKIGPSIDDRGIHELQSSILRQLGRGENLEFPAPAAGREQLSKHLQQLGNKRKPVFLAIDNVYESGDLRSLLPATLSKDIPASSVIVITCRMFSVAREFLNQCKLDRRRNESQILLFIPEYLNPEESKELFAKCGDLSEHEHADLLENMVPLCGGFPLALTILGRLFVDSSKREEWELIKEQMEKLAGGDDMETADVTKALQVTYDQLNEKCKTAFCEVVMFFYGWKWARVERILGVNVLKVLKESCLISEAEDWSKCNQSALCKGHLDFRYREELDETRVVTMHDLTLRFGQGVYASLLKVMTITESRAMNGYFQRLEASKLRHLILSTSDISDHEIKFPILESLEETRNLQTLDLACAKYDPPVLKASSYRNVLSTDEQSSLHALRLYDWKHSRRIMEMKLSCEIREIYLSDCDDVEQLPSSISLHNLEVLVISRCKNFKDLPPSSVREWRNLKYLALGQCPCLTSVPAELGRLKKLCHLSIQSCDNLQALPTLSCPLQKVHLASIPIANLELEEAACLHLQRIDLHINYSNASSAKAILAAFGSASSLQSLTILAEQLVELPENVGNLVVLTELDLSGCRSLKRLSPSIGNVTCLQQLSLEDCENLVELPDEVGKLTALTDFQLSGCTRLKKLPPNIGNATSLEYLSLIGCETLVELPEGVGNLTALTILNLLGCTRLKKLPPNIGNATSLEILNLSECETLVELPEGVGNLTALTNLDLSGCTSLEKLPPNIGNATSLEFLSLSEFETLVELPEGVGNLTALTNLDLSGCRNLKTLPPNIGNATSLKYLNLRQCETLVELPAEGWGNLSALRHLNLNGCKTLKGLPPAIGNVVSLEKLRLRGCESMEELPDEVGKLELLEELDLTGCTSLKRLPSAVRNLRSLRTLILEGCVALVEPPDVVGKLANLAHLALLNCKNFERLPTNFNSDMETS